MNNHTCYGGTYLGNVLKSEIYILILKGELHHEYKY